MFRTIVALIVLFGLIYLICMGLYKLYKFAVSEDIEERKRLEKAKLELDLADYTLTQKMKHIERNKKYYD